MDGQSDRAAQLGAKVHISLNVRCVERSVEFYSAFFGARPHKVRPGYANFNLEDPPLKLALNELPAGACEPTLAGPSSGLNHLGIQVSDCAAVDSARERLISAGLATFDEGDTTCCYAQQNKIWATDPDGHAWEVYVLLDDMEPTADSCCEPTASACCEPMSTSVPIQVTLLMERTER